MAKMGYDTYPEQMDAVGSRALVIFGFDTARPLPATVLRDDGEEPFRTVLRLDDGRIVMGSECQWTAMPEADEARWPDPGIPIHTGKRPG